MMRLLASLLKARYIAPPYKSALFLSNKQFLIVPMTAFSLCNNTKMAPPLPVKSFPDATSEKVDTAFRVVRALFSMNDTFLSEKEGLVENVKSSVYCNDRPPDPPWKFLEVANSSSPLFSNNESLISTSRQLFISNEPRSKFLHHEKRKLLVIIMKNACNEMNVERIVHHTW